MATYEVLERVVQTSDSEERIMRCCGAYAMAAALAMTADHPAWVAHTALWNALTAEECNRVIGIISACRWPVAAGYGPMFPKSLRRLEDKDTIESLAHALSEKIDRSVNSVSASFNQ